MKVCTWNMNKVSTGRKTSWTYLKSLDPDIVLLQEVVSIPDRIKSIFDILFEYSTKKAGKHQIFGNAIMVKGKITKRILLSSKLEGVNEELLNLKGNFICAEATLYSGDKFNVVSCHSPSWSLNKKKFSFDEIQKIKLKNNKDIWGTELIWSALKEHLPMSDLDWIVGGDFNASTTFDIPRNRGNQEFLDRMKDITLEECLFNSNGCLSPTFKNSSNKQKKHQIDHLFVTQSLLKKLENCVTGDKVKIFDKLLSDHLPIIAEFKP